MARSCPKCGHPVALPPSAAYRRTEGMAVASLVCGLLGVLGCPLVPSIVAVVLAIQARRKLSEDPTLEGEGLAKAGLILGWVGVGLGVLIVGGVIALFLSGVNIDVPSDGIDALGRIG